mmetsp:Transcript_3447/g.5134  ORF Transcript_3447/g.5134 Transcript_3447/m.5134 type:complete len:245 (+) Transcript_3447:3047-3781(+)
MALLLWFVNEMSIDTSMTPVATSWVLSGTPPDVRALGKTLIWLKEHSSNPLLRLIGSTPVPNTSSLIVAALSGYVSPLTSVTLTRSILRSPDVDTRRRLLSALPCLTLAALALILAVGSILTWWFSSISSPSMSRTSSPESSSPALIISFSSFNCAAVAWIGAEMPETPSASSAFNSHSRIMSGSSPSSRARGSIAMSVQSFLAMSLRRRPLASMTGAVAAEAKSAQRAVELVRRMSNFFRGRK